jgi:hypothetical protein
MSKVTLTREHYDAVVTASKAQGTAKFKEIAAELGMDADTAWKVQAAAGLRGKTKPENLAKYRAAVTRALVRGGEEDANTEPWKRSRKPSA